VLVGFGISLDAQSKEDDVVDFYDPIKFKQSIVYKTDTQIAYVQYEEIEGDLRKIDYFDSKNRKIRDKIWRDSLLSETEYKYFENNQIIKRYDVINQKPLPTQLRINFRYPAIAIENEIFGVVEVALSYNNDCIPESYNILNSLGYGIDEEVNKGMKLMLTLAKKYNVPFEKCKESNEYFKVNFKLE
jgi:hypothetical protein